MPIYEDKSFKDYVNGLPAATENDLAAGNNMPVVSASDVKKMDGENVAKSSEAHVKANQEELNELYTPVKNLVTSFIDGVYPSRDSANNLVLAPANYSTIEITLRLGQRLISFSRLGSMNFSKVYDSTKKFIANLSEYNKGSYYELPANAKYIYTAAGSWFGNCPDIVAFEGIVNMTGLSSVDFPFGELKRVKLEKLYSNINNDFVENLLLKSKYEGVFEDKLKNVVCTLSNWAPNVGAVLTRTSPISGTAVLDRQYAGFVVGTYKAYSDSVLVRFKGTQTEGCKIHLTLRSYDASATMTSTELKVIESAEFDEYVTFSADYFAVYKNASYFGFLVNQGEAVHNEIHIEEFYIRDNDALQKSKDYDTNLRQMIINMEGSIAEAAESGGGSSATFDGFMMAGNGHRYKMGVNYLGELFSTPTIPNKVMVLGNSLLLGMDTNGAHGGAFGMCASDPYHDFFYFLKQSITAKNPSCEFLKLHDAAFEQAETNTASQAYWTDNQSSFDTDIDLVIIQIGDNVNNDARVQVFGNNFGVSLVQKIKERCPRARVICACGWFNYLRSSPAVKAACEKYGCDFIPLYDLNTAENQGYSGQVVTYYDGTTKVVPDTYITHPGDLGMQRIAERIVEKMNME